MDKKDRIFYRYKHDQTNLKNDCVDLISKSYLMLGQKPDTQQVVLMAQMLFNDLVKSYSSMTMDKVNFAFEQGIKFHENGGFVNVRNWNVWLKKFKYDGEVQQEYQRHLEWSKENDLLITQTINKAKKIGNNDIDK